MAFEKPPSLDNFDEIIPKAPKQITPQQRKVRALLVVFGVLTLLLGLLNLWKSDLTAPLRGTGSVRGMALDAQGQPFQGNIFVERTELRVATNVDGSFEVKNIPAGPQFIVVADAVSGREFPVVIQPGQTTDLGTVQFKTTETP